MNDYMMNAWLKYDKKTGKNTFDVTSSANSNFKLFFCEINKCFQMLIFLDKQMCSVAVSDYKISF